MSNVVPKLKIILEMIKFEHTIFALPFAFTGALLALGGLPSLRQAFWIVVAMVGARSAAMGFNRWADRDIDARNPRTKTRALPLGLVTRHRCWRSSSFRQHFWFWRRTC